MELVWLIVQAIVLCTALFAVTCGLMVAPWYVLLAALGMVLVVSQQLMPGFRQSTLEATISGVKKSAAIAQTNAPIRPTPSTSTVSSLADPHPPHLIYRGADYIPSQNTEPLAAHPSGHLIYRGVDYVPSQTGQPSLTAHPSGHLIYRGVDYVLSPDTEDPTV